MTYNEYINNIIKTRGQWNIQNGDYYEMHHITPMCMGGKGDCDNGGFKRNSHHSNCIWLYAHEHFTAHKLLAEENRDNYRLVLGWVMMAYPKTKNHKRDYEITQDEYEELKTFSYEAKKLMPHKKGLTPWNKGKTGVYSAETLEKISATSKGRKAFLGHHHSNETKDKIRESKLGKKLNSRTGISRKGKHYYTNGVETKMFVEGQQPKDWIRSNANKADGKKWFNNGKQNKLCFECPEGFTEGMLKK